MCGLAGFVRHPDGDKAVLVHEVGEHLLLAMKTRGRHATGLAAFPVQGPPLTWKRAAPADLALSSPEWEAIRRSLPACSIVLGHTRHATHANAHVDECAHPFTFGEVTGAHNGIIDNWRTLAGKGKTVQPWQVDSEAAFALLAKAKDPVKALDKLDGYWALTWVKNGRFHACRTPESPLAMAYAPQLRTLFWCSLKEPLHRILKDAGIKFDGWEAQPGTLYTYDPLAFTTDGTHVVKRDAPFRGRTRGGARVDPRTNGRSLQPSGGYSTRRTVPGGEQFDAFNRAASAQNDGVDRREVVRLSRRVDDLTGQVETLQGQVKFLFALLEEAGIRVPPALTCVECGKGTTDGLLHSLPDGTLIHDDCILDQLRDGDVDAVARRFESGMLLNVGMA